MKQKDFTDSLKQKISIDTKNIEALEKERSNIKDLISFIEARIKLDINEKTLVKADIGSGVFIEAQINNPLTIILNIGLDIYAEVPLAMALGILAKRLTVTSRKIDLLHKEMAKNNAYLRLTSDILKQLSDIGSSQDSML